MSIAASLFVYGLAALAEIAGCFAFWAWLKLDKTPLWLIPGMVCLILFALLLTRVELDFAGRTFAAYGGIYIIASILWLWLVEQQLPTRWDIAGAVICLIGAATILLGNPGRQ